MRLRPLNRWQRGVAYGVFTLVMFVFFLMLTFPFDIVEERLVAEAAKQGYVLTVGSVGPGFFGITARRIEVFKPALPGAAEESGALPIDSLALRPALFPPGVAFRASMLSGTVKGSIGGIRAVALDVQADSIALDDPRLRALAGVDLVGVLSLDVDLDVPLTEPGKSGKRLIDPSQTDGHLGFDIKGARVDGGKIMLTLPMMGNVPTAVPLNKVALGDVSARMNFKKGQGTLDTFQGRGDDLELAGSGTLQLARSLVDSRPSLDIKVKADDAATTKLGMLGMAISSLPKDTESPGFRIARLGGSFRRPEMRKR